MTDKHTSKWAIRPLVPEEVYTDRQEHIDYLYQVALKAITRRSMSTVLMGQRRMGKTEIFKRVVNRLFFEQEHPVDTGNSVVPVYYSFSDQPADPWSFSIEYTENFLRWYVAFRLQEPFVLNRKEIKREHLTDFIRSRLKVTRGLRLGLNHLEHLQDRDVTIPEKESLLLPREVSDWDESTIVMFLDEFQNTHLPQHEFRIVGYMQEAVESPTCPHFVTGSAMSILDREILGRGVLFGRFRSHPIEPMTEYWGSELALRASGYYQARINQSVAPLLATRCGGNPYYITAVIQQAAEQEKRLEDEESINEILAVDLSSGFIWGELSDQVARWIERINAYGITKWILYLSALEEEEKISLVRIQRELREKEDTDVAIETIRDVLMKLSRGDLLEYMDSGDWFRKIDDPVLVDFLRVWGRIAVEGKSQVRVVSETVKQYQERTKRFSDHQGYLAGVYMAQLLWNFQRKTFPADSVHAAQDVVLPDRFYYIWHRVRLGAGSGREIDIYGAAGADIWIGESKWWRDKKVGVREVRAFLGKKPLVEKEEGQGLRSLQMWFFSHSGFSQGAERLMQEKGVLYSDKEDLNHLLELAGLRRLPELKV